MPESRARLGDPSDHGGTIVTAAASVFADGIPVARIGDLHACPIPGHGVTAILTGSAAVVAEGSPVALVGVSTCGCGATISAGSPDVVAD